MGVSVTCSGESFESLHDSLDTLLKSLSLSSKDDMIKSTHRSISLNERSFKSEEKTWGSGKLVIKRGSLSFNKKKESFHVESETSREIPICQKDTPQVQVNDEDDNNNNNNNRNTRFAPMPAEKISQPDSPKHQAALRLQKVYKSFRTRRQLADCAVLIEQRWWKLLDFALLKRSSVSFFEGEKTESVLSKWARAKSRAAKVGKGLSKDEKARKLALQHWLEAIDPRHRYGHNLQFYYDHWLRCESKQPFFYWLDVGEGKEASFDEKCPRSKLQQQCIKYLGPKEREDYEVIVEDGKLMYKKSGQVLDSIQGPRDSKWIFVLSTSKNLYVGQKKKGVFQHSSFLAGGATSAAGRLEIQNGILKAIWPHSGHYRPTEENFQEFVTFLKEKNIDLTNVKKSPVEEEEEEKCNKLRPSLSDIDLSTRENKENSEQGGSNSSNGLKRSGSFHASPSSTPKKKTSEDSEESEEEEPGEKKTKETSPCIFKRNNYRFRKPNLFVGREEETVPSEVILGRMKFKKEKLSLQLGKQLSCRWTTGAGPRIGCVRDYPSMLRCLALEQVNLSPRNEGATRDFPSPWKFPSSIPRANSLNSLNNTPERDL